MDHRPGPALADRARAAGGRNLRRAANGLRLWANVDPPEVGATPKLRRLAPRPQRALALRRTTRDRTGRPSSSCRACSTAAGSSTCSRARASSASVLDADLDTYMLDWGVPDERDADRGLAGYVDLLRAAIASDRATCPGRRRSCCSGTAWAASSRCWPRRDDPELPIGGILALTTPVVVSELGFLVELFDKGLRPSHVIDERGLVPAERIAQGFRLIRPSGVLLQRAELWHHLWNDEFLEGYRAIDGWVNDPIPMSGRALRGLGRPRPVAGRRRWPLRARRPRRVVG